MSAAEQLGAQYVVNNAKSGGGGGATSQIQGGLDKLLNLHHLLHQADSLCTLALKEEHLGLAGAQISPPTPPPAAAST